MGAQFPRMGTLRIFLLYVFLMTSVVKTGPGKSFRLNECALGFIHTSDLLRYCDCDYHTSGYHS